MRPARRPAASLPGLLQLRALALISFALVGPAGLPAGGAEAKVPEVRRRQRSSEPLTVPLATALRCEPQRQAPVIVQVAAGAPLRPLRRWFAADGQRWIQVELAPGLGRRPIHGGAATISGARRGWLLEAET